MSLDPGMKCIKYLLFAFNFLFVLTGLAVLVSGIIAQFAYKGYLNFVGDAVLSAPLLLIIVGVIIFLVAFCGCCGAVKEQKFLIITFTVLLSLIFVLELAAGIAAYVYNDKVDTYINRNMKDTLKNYKGPNSQGVTKTWDLVQHDLRCCGIEGPKDWATVPSMEQFNLPTSCCREPVEGCGTDALSGGGSVDSSDFYTDGCYESLKDFIERHIAIIAGITIGIAFVQLIGIVLGCCLYKAMKEPYETV